MSNRVTFLDGGFSTWLETQYKMEIGQSKLWSASLLLDEDLHDVIISAHLDFLRMGSDIITAGSYQASIERFMEEASLTEELAREHCVMSASLALSARDQYMEEITLDRSGEVQPVKVAASLSPYGAYLANGSEYRGDYVDTIASKESIQRWHARKLSLYAASGVDILLCETFPAQAEVCCLLDALSSEKDSFSRSPAYPAVYVSLSVGTNQAGKLALPNGSLEETIALILRNPNVDVMGLNCFSVTHSQMALQTLHAAWENALHTSSRPRSCGLLLSPNSGESWDDITRNWGNDHMPQSFSWHEILYDAWLNSHWSRSSPAASLTLGGCCRVTPDDIWQLRQSFD